MSAFIVGKEHIDFLVLAADSYSPRGPGSYPLRARDEHIYTSTGAGLKRLGQILWDENFRSVETRYPTTKELPGPIGTMRDARPVYELPAGLFMRPRAEPGKVFAAIACLEYQSCETENWESTAAHSLLQQLRRLVERACPGYEGTWEISTAADACEVMP